MNSKQNILLFSLFLLSILPFAIMTNDAIAADAYPLKSENEKLVTVYLLIDSPAQLQQYVNDLNRVNKVNFNRIIFSFVKPTMTNYTSGSLANTGILGYFNEHDGNGVAAINELKKALLLPA